MTKAKSYTERSREIYSLALERLDVDTESGVITRKPAKFLREDLHGTNAVRSPKPGRSPFIRMNVKTDSGHRYVTKISPSKLVWFAAYGTLPQRVHQINRRLDDFRISNLALVAFDVTFRTRGRHSLTVEETARVPARNHIEAINKLINSADVLSVVHVKDVGSSNEWSSV